MLAEAAEVRPYKRGTSVTLISGWEPLWAKASHYRSHSKSSCDAFPSAILSAHPTKPQEHKIWKHCLNQTPSSVKSAISCHLSQLVSFHFSVGAMNSRNDRNRNCSSETWSWKPANHTCKASEPVCFTLLWLLGLQCRPLKRSYWFSTTLQSASWFYSRFGKKEEEILTSGSVNILHQQLELSHRVYAIKMS